MPPRRQSSEIASGYRNIRQQAQKLLINLRREMRDREAELRRMRKEAGSLSVLAGQAAPATTERRGRGRINWRNVLQQVPKQFKASDVRAVRGLKDKRPSEIFAAITRWIEAGLVKRKSRGTYERS